MMTALLLLAAPVAPPGGKLVMTSTPYAEVRKRVESGEKVIMLVKPVLSITYPVRLGFTTLRCDDAPLSPGRYDCERLSAQPCMTQKESYIPEPATAEGWYWLLRGQPLYCPPGRT